MKRLIFGILLVVLLVVSQIYIVNASQSNNITLIWSNEERYEITIPSEIVVDTTTNKTEINIEVDEFQAEENSSIVVSVSSENYDNGWFLVNVKNPEYKIEYAVGSFDGGKDIESGEEIGRLTEPGTITTYIEILDVGNVGQYEDIITFTSQIKNQPSVEGTWIFNEDIVPLEYNLSQSVNFTVEGKNEEFNEIQLYYNDSYDSPEYDYYFSIKFTIDSGSVLSYYNLEQKWHDIVPTIHFASKQNVSEEFYNWFIANAVKQ